MQIMKRMLKTLYQGVMSENFVIDTVKMFTHSSMNLRLLPEIHPMLRQTIPNCDMILPNTMNTLIHRLHKTMKTESTPI